MHIALTLSTLLLVALVATVSGVCWHIKRSASARVLQSAPKERYVVQHRTVELYRPWAQHFGFEWIDSYAVRGLDGRFIAAFRHRDQPLFFQLEVARGVTHYEFHSVFNREQTLITTSAIGVVPPTPAGWFMQRFPDADLTALFREHTRVHDALLESGTVKLVPFPVRVDRAMVESWLSSNAFLTSLSFWQLRTLDWVLLAPRRVRNRSVLDQLDLSGANASASMVSNALSAASSAAGSAASSHKA